MRNKRVQVFVSILFSVILLKFTKGYGSKYKQGGGFTDSIDNNLPLSVFMDNMNKSIVVSSLLVRLPMCMLALIAQGESEVELMSALGLKTSEQAMNCYNGDTRNILSKVIGSSLTMVNQMYVNSSKDLDKGIFDNTQDKFGIDAEPAVFKFYRNARAHINNWIDSKTLRRLRNTLDPEDIQANTSILVITAAHFKISWEKKFNELLTRNKIFRTLDDRRIMVPMMTISQQYPFYDDHVNEFYLVTPFLLQPGLSFTLVVPYKIHGLPMLLKKMADDPTIIQEARLKSRSSVVRIQMPRFKIRTKVDLDEHLKLLGVRSIYNTSLKVNGLKYLFHQYSKRDCEYIALSKVKQQVHIDVDEYGVYRPNSHLEMLHPGGDMFNGFDPPSDMKFKEVHADHPFMFSVNLIDQTIYEDGPRIDVSRELFTGVYYGPEVPDLT